MAGPITPEKLGAHPALQQFIEYVEHHSGEPVDLSRVDVETQREQIPNSPDNNVRNDGIIELSYSLQEKSAKDIPNHVFYGMIHGPNQAMVLRHGWLTPRDRNGKFLIESQWPVEPLPTAIQGACALVKDLGGEMEAKAPCQDFPQASQWARAYFSVLSLDLSLSLFKTSLYRQHGTFPLTRLAIKSLTPTGAQQIGASSRVFMTAPPVLFGAGFFLTSQGLADQVMGWDSRLHRHERFAVGAAVGYGAYRTVASWIKPPPLPGAAGVALTKRVPTMSFGSGLLTAGLVDALIGDSLQEGSVARDALRGSAFFLPAIYQGMMGTCTLPLVAKHPRLAAGGRIAAGAATIGFVTDVGIMAYRHVTEGEAETARNNRLYKRAKEIQSHRQSWFQGAWRGLLGMIMPSFTERNTVSEEYLESARREMKDHATGLTSSAAQILRHHMIFGNGGEDQALEFYQKLDWNNLRSGNHLGVIKKGEGKHDWYLDSVAGDLADPKIRYEYLENKSAEQQIRFIQDRYRWNLSVGDVQEILGRIALVQARADLAQIHSYVTPEESGWAKIFDESGKLRTGEEKNLIIHLFASLGEVPSEEQILALRKVALLVRIRQFREIFKGAESHSQEPWADPEVKRAHRDLVAYEGIAKQLGLMGQDGNFTQGEIHDQAMRMPVVQAILQENSSGLL